VELRHEPAVYGIAESTSVVRADVRSYLPSRNAGRAHQHAVPRHLLQGLGDVRAVAACRPSLWDEARVTRYFSSP
jgi:hypothetical protein